MTKLTIVSGSKEVNRKNTLVIPSSEVRKINSRLNKSSPPAYERGGEGGTKCFYLIKCDGQLLKLSRAPARVNLVVDKFM